MTEPVPIAMGRGSNKGRFTQLGTAQFINAYVEELGDHGKTAFSAVAINGWQLFSTLTGGGAVRAMLAVESVLLAVAGRLLFSTGIGGTPVTIVSGIASDGLVTMARNRATPNPHVAIVCDGLVYFYQGGSLVQNTDSDLPPPICVVELDGYFIFPIRDGRWFIAGPNLVSIDALDFAEAESSADSNVMAAVRGRTLILLGERSTEFWDPNGSATFPFARTAAATFGCYAAGTVANAIIWRGKTLVDTIAFAATDSEGAYAGIVVLDGYSPTVISTPEVDRLVRDEPDKESLRGAAWTEDGRPFYALSGTSFTRVYDGRSGEWHARESHGLSRWRASCHAHFDNKVLFGHYDDFKVYESRADLLDEAGDPIIYRIQPPPIVMWPKGFKVATLYVDMITGVGTNSGVSDDDDPEMVIEASKDGGDHFGVARRVKLGQQGNKKRIKERTFGRFDHNGMTLRFTCSAKVRKGMQQLALVATPLRG